jgi:pSer/pThr/pTyr-binding forkhead associated (FHA) protein
VDAQLIVVEGKHQGKTIALRGPVFRIGRGETCHLRPNSAQVSREHAEFVVSGDTVSVRDLGSRNGTLVNGKALTASCVLKDRDVVKVGPLTFAVSLSGAATPAEAVAAATAATQGSAHDTDSWLLADVAVGGDPKSGDTVLIPAFTGASAPELDDEAFDESYERQAASEHDARDKKPRAVDAPAAQRPKTKAGEVDPGTDIIRKIMGYRRPNQS